MQRIEFKDDDEFYKKLASSLKSGEGVEVSTEIERYSELPERLRKVFDLDEHRSSSWVSVAGAFVGGATAPARLNTKALVVMGTTGVGAAVGILAGPLGVAVGAGLGLATGTIAAAFLDGKHAVELEVDKRGKLKIKMRPTTPEA